jgi:hypothetical protein
MPGGWYIDYYVKGVCKRKKIGSSNQVAELALTQVQVKIAKGEYLGIHEEKKLTFRQFAPEYLAYLGRDAVRERHETTGFYKWPHRDSNSGFCRERANYGTDRTDIEQVLKEKKPFILHCMPSDLKVMQGRSPAWNRCALNASII